MTPSDEDRPPVADASAAPPSADPAPAPGHPSGDRPGPGRSGGSAGGQTKDDTDAGWGEAPDRDQKRDQHEQWLHEQRPPHWE